ncbi:HAD family hydrolase [Streptomyces physcomitrii]|uniref:HAD family hydrolase n=1 Tax=Streptomyces physcomitrii TaxID=2724184 RepID=UPI0028A6A0EA|nr:HAD-IA family hydrolase [Streptomyces physcomitrii]
MTSETAQTPPLPTPSESLRALVAAARFVLFDFDGPVCRLFAGHRAEQVAAEQVRWLEERGLRGLLTAEELTEPDPQSVLRAVAARHPKSDLVAELEERLTQQELKAVATAWPTPYADPLIRTWRATGVPLAITTNNSAKAARGYLEGRGLAECFSPHFYGRTEDLRLLKPDPHCLRRALNALGAEPSAALMIGDTPTDLRAAERAGVSFLGYARNEDSEGRLREAGAEHLVSTLQPLLELVRGRRSS